MKQCLYGEAIAAITGTVYSYVEMDRPLPCVSMVSIDIVIELVVSQAKGNSLPPKMVFAFLASFWRKTQPCPEVVQIISFLAPSDYEELYQMSTNRFSAKAQKVLGDLEKPLYF